METLRRYAAYAAALDRTPELLPEADAAVQVRVYMFARARSCMHVRAFVCVYLCARARDHVRVPVRVTESCARICTCGCVCVSVSE